MRKLKLGRETLRDLDHPNLRKAAGGANLSVNGCWTPVVRTLPLNNCIVVRTLQGCTTAVDCP